MGPLLGVLLLLLTGLAHAVTVVEHEAGELRIDTPPQRIVALNWWLAEHLLALGVTPVAVAEKEGYAQWVSEPALPASVKSVGRRQAPNLEAIRALEPDLILVSGHLMSAVPALERIAPVLVQTVYQADSNPWLRAREHLLTLARLLDREARARAVLARAEDRLARQHQRLAQAGLADQPVFVVRFLDDRRLRIQGRNAMLHQALEQIGLHNAWTGKTNLWGFSPGTIADLGGVPGAFLIYLKPWPESDRQRLQSSPLWAYLPMATSGRIAGIGPVWTFGGVLSVPRMAAMLTEQLLANSGATP